MEMIKASPVKLTAGLTALFAVMWSGVSHAAVDYTTLTSGLVTKFEDGVTQALPILAAVIGAFLVIGTIRRVVGH